MRKYSDDDESTITQDSDVRNFNFHLLKADNELYNEEENVASKVIRAKRIRLPKNGENWQILEDNQVVLLMKGTRFSKGEREFLRTAEGMKFLVAEFKIGCNSVVKLKKKLKKVLR